MGETEGKVIFNGQWERTGMAPLAVSLAVIGGLYLTSLSNYLLFHSLAELFSILVAVGIFIIAWNARSFIDNSYLLLVGIAYLFVGFIDLYHTLAYKGMGVFAGAGANLPTQLWIAARYLESLTLLAAPFFLGRKLNHRLIFIGYATATSLLLWSIFLSGGFPDCFIDGVGLTPFKKGSEYAICLILTVSTLLLWHRRNDFSPKVFRLLLCSIILTIVSELAFTVYVSVYGLSNVVGHIIKVFSFYLAYKAIIETALVRPYDLIFRDLKLSQSALARVNEELEFKNVMLSTQQDTSIDGILVVDDHATVIYYNQRFAEMWSVSPEMTGLTSGELADQFILDKLVEPQGYLARDACHHAHNKEKSREEITLKDGRVFDSYSSPMAGADKRYYGKVWYFRDITEQKRIEEHTIHLASFPQLDPNPVLEVDSSGKVTFINPATQKILEALGMGMENIAVFLPACLNGILSNLDKNEESSIYREIFIKERVFAEEIYRSPRFSNVVRIYARDITEHKQSEMERERLIRDLQGALANIKTLSGMLPICACCKKIRDDKGYWNHLESYISEHSEALFSHGYCPDCSNKAYKELEELKKGRLN